MKKLAYDSIEITKNAVRYSRGRASCSLIMSGDQIKVLPHMSILTAVPFTYDVLMYGDAESFYATLYMVIDNALRVSQACGDAVRADLFGKVAA